MAPLVSRHGAPGRAAIGLVLAGALTLAVGPATAAPGGARARGKAAKVSSTVLVPVEGSACLFPIPGQECSEEERRLCDAPLPPDPVIVDCHDPANAWVLEMVGECECNLPHAAVAHFTRDHDRERSREGACLDAESCSAPRPTASGTSVTFDYQPAIDRQLVSPRAAEQRLPLPAETTRQHPGFARGIERPPRA